MVHFQSLRQQQVLRAHHVGIAVVREMRAQAIAWLAGLAVPDAIGQHDEVARRIEGLPGAEELACEFRTHETAARAAGPVHDEHGVAHDAVGIGLRMPEGAVMNAQLRAACRRR